MGHGFGLGLSIVSLQLPLPNGSCLSCGRPARRRKGGGRQSVPRQGHNTPLPLKRSPPGSFKRLLGSVPSEIVVGIVIPPNEATGIKVPGH